ncbi:MULTISPECIES: hypothetical protein [unclassified Natrinema]|uniref:hypothetical protein n=1 Tax=unclassified Natrinema TaxID=2622230 RepID=UPI00026D46F4|nr:MULTISPECIES: hypothetical protein [unclassified Natrinema]AFO55594.1 hypothetical protein NJ7G_0341 [Natrinema sp. J7-2]
MRSVTLSSDDLNDTDRAIVAELERGRVTPQYLASERLKRLLEHEHVVRLALGLYELENDPREDGSFTE